MRQTLKPHPDTPCRAVAHIRVAIARPRADQLQLTYLVSGEIDDLRLPQPATPTRTDKLWEHTCFEAFIREGDAPTYREFNFSPSTKWAAYGFTGYREGMANAEFAPPVIETHTTRGTFTLKATIALDVAETPHRLALSAVIEETDGRKSYWALAHPPGQPDFHHPACFVLALPRASAS